MKPQDEYGALRADSVTADTIAAGSIETYHIVVGAIIADLIAAGAITADKLATNAIQSLNYVAGIPYSVSGTFLDLATGQFQTPNFLVRADGLVLVRGDITATALSIRAPNSSTEVARIAVDTSLAYDRYVFRMLSGAANDAAPTDLRWLSSSAPSSQRGVLLAAGRANGQPTSRRAELDVINGSSRSYARLLSNANVSADTATVTASSDTSGTGRSYAEIGAQRNSTSAGVWCEVDNTTPTIYLTCGGAQMTMQPFGGAMIIGNNGNNIAILDNTAFSAIVSVGPSVPTAEPARVRIGDVTSGTRAIVSEANSTATRIHQSFRNPNGMVGSISTNGSSTAFNTSSDERLKERHELHDNGDLIDRLKVWGFSWPDGSPDVGFMAQELHDEIPDAVHVGGADVATDPWMVDHSKLVPYLVAELQSLRQRVAELEAAAG